MRAKAQLLGSRIEFTGQGTTAVTVQDLGGGSMLVIFPFGVVVSIGLDDAAESAAIEPWRRHVGDPIAEPESESYSIEIDPDRPERVAGGHISLRAYDVDRMQIVAHALAKSVVLAHFEHRVATVMANVEDLAARMRTGGSAARTTELLREIGDALMIQAKTIGRAEVGEKPDLTWEFPDLDALFDRLASDLELHERDAALSRKLSLISSTATLYLDVIQTRKGIRVEWYIVALIVVEIVLSIYDRFFSA